MTSLSPRVRVAAFVLMTIAGRPLHAQDIKPVQAQEVKPVQAQEVKPVQAQEIKPVTSQQAKPVQAQQPRARSSGDIQPFQAEEARLRKPAGPPTCSATAPRGTPRPDGRIAGTWAMVVPGVAYSQDFDRGSYIERVQTVAAGAPAGALTIGRDGRFTWKKRSGRYAGTLGWCTSTDGKSGWTVHDDREQFFVGYLDGQNGGFYLFSTVTGDYVFRGQPVR